MGNIEDGNEILNIRKTPALNRFLFFLKDSVSQGEIDQSELEEIKSLMPVDEKHMFHFVLSTCLDGEEFQKIFSSERTEEMFTDILWVIDDDEMEKMSSGMYLDIVLGLNLIEHCLCMVLTDPRMGILKEISEGLTSRLALANTTTVIGSSLFDAIMTCFIKLSRVQDELVGRFYSKCLTELVQSFVALQFPEIGKCEKLVTLLRLFGVAILHEDDYQYSDEISVLLDEWEFDKSVTLMKSVSLKIYEALLDTKSELRMLKRLDKHIITVLDNCIQQLITAEWEEESVKKEISVSSQKLTLSSYLGGCAYLTQMLVERRCRSVQPEDIPNTLQCIKAFVKDKPKMKHEEVIEDIQDFFHFCERMNKYGDREIYRRDWTTRFLSFSPDEIIGTPEGNSIVETFIIGADYDLIIECVKKIRDVDNLFLDEPRKELILRIITQERTSKHETQDFISELFQDGANNKLMLENFKAELHLLSLQLGNIEFEKDLSKLATHQLAVIRLCLQDPIVAVTKILDQSVRMEHFRALGFASPFFTLRTGATNEEVADSDVSTVLIVDCFSKVLKYLPAYPNSVYDSLSSSMGELISLSILSEVNLFSVLKFHILKSLSGNNRIALQIVMGLVSLLENLIKLVSENSLTNEIGGFVINLNRFFCQFTNSKTFSEAVKIKNMLARMIKLVSTSLNFTCDITKQKEEVENLNLFDQGMLYVRCDQFRPLINSLFEMGTDDLSFKEFVQVNVLPWILNSTEEQWNSLIEFIFSVAMSATSKLYRVKNANKMHLLNQALLLMYLSCTESKCTDAFLHTVRFYDLAVDVIQSQFAENEWYSLFDTVLTICVEMNIGSRKHKKGKGYQSEVIGLHQILSFLLSKIEEFAKTSRNISGCDRLASKLNRITQLDSKCEPVRWLISEKLTSIQDSCEA